MEGTKFRLAARTDAAGKYNPNAPLEGNEDNMFVDCFLDDNKQGVFMGDVIVDLSERGCLMVVADGMGGMNAGEVASDIAIKTVEKYFAPGKLDEKVFKDSKSRISYMEEVVVAADAAIKADSTSNPEHEGMGSTIIMAWLCDNEICLTWCGDSRAYLFRPGQGFWQVSKDHSYVQGLVDEGKITEVEAFDHPYGNIITRSLGDPDKKARPESRSFKVYQDDIFMLCSDGLSGVVRDRKTYRDGQRLDTDNLEDIIAENRESMAECRDRLFEAAQRNDWYDNVTAILCEIVQGEPAPKGNKGNEPIPNTTSSEGFYGSNNAPNFKRKRPRILWLAALIVVLGVVVYLSWSLFDSKREVKLFRRCESSMDTTLCNEYLKKYPNGEFADKVKEQKSKIIEQLTPEPPEQKLTEATNSPEPVQPTDSQPSRGGAGSGLSSGTSSNKGVNTGTSTGASIGTEASSGSSGEVDDDSSGVTGVAPKESSGEEKDKKTISAEERIGGLVEDGGLKPGGLVEDPSITPEKPSDPSVHKTPEEKAYEKCPGSLDGCTSYLKKFTNGPHRESVEQQFKNLYEREFKQKLEACKTEADLKKLLNEFNKLMNDTHMIGTSIGNRLIESLNQKAEDKRKELSNNANNDRPQPGANSSTAPKRIVAKSK